MSRRILKWTIPPAGIDVETADDPRWLAAGAQGSDVVVWAEATVGAGVIHRVLGVITGADAPPEGQASYIGTAQQADGIVVHVYHGRVFRP